MWSQLLSKKIIWSSLTVWHPFLFQGIPKFVLFSSWCQKPGESKIDHFSALYLAYLFIVGWTIKFNLPRGLYRNRVKSLIRHWLKIADARHWHIILKTLITPTLLQHPQVHCISLQTIHPKTTSLVVWKACSPTQQNRLNSQNTRINHVLSHPPAEPLRLSISGTHPSLYPGYPLI